MSLREKLNLEIYNQIIILQKQGKTLDEIGVELGIGSKQAVYYYIQKYGSKQIQQSA